MLVQTRSTASAMPVSNRNRAFTTAVFALTHGCSLRLVSDFMDDANMPSLLSLPIYGYLNQTDEIYARTRAAVLSSRNPWSSNGTAGAGVGSPHTGAHAACERVLSLGCVAHGAAALAGDSSRCAPIHAGSGVRFRAAEDLADRDHHRGADGHDGCRGVAGAERAGERLGMHGPRA